MDRFSERVKITTSCRDCDDIPKVVDAGEVVHPVSGKPYQIMHNGLKVTTDSLYGILYSDWMIRIIQSLKGHHEPQEEKVFYEALKEIPPNAVMIELGSYWAYYSMWFNQSIKNARNYMIEPMQEVMAYGYTNFNLNNMKGIFTQACIGKTSKDKVDFKHWNGTLHKVPQLAVDDFIEHQKIPYVDILHTDIQGAEYNMLLGCQKAIRANKIAFIFLSTHSEMLHQQCIHF